MKKVVLSLMVFLVLFVTPFNLNRSEFDNNVKGAISGYEFSLARWQVNLLRGFINSRETLSLSKEEGVEVVWSYFNGEHENKRLVELVISRQVEEALSEIGLAVFPRVHFTITPMPGYLVISPIEEIRRKKEIHVIPALTRDKREEIEGWVDALGVSSIVTNIAGTSTFPIVVAEGTSLRNTIRIVAHEWAHHHLFFRPLGFRYGLHFLGWKNDAVAAINEAAATIVEMEIEEIVYNRYYSDFEKDIQLAGIGATFDYRDQMQLVREKVDQLLLMGEIEEAERYMEEQRQYINSYGYDIRKLNQAYFAFHGSYPSISVNPLTRRVYELREESDSLRRFLYEIGKVWNAQDLLEIEIP